MKKNRFVTRKLKLMLNKIKTGLQICNFTRQRSVSVHFPPSSTRPWNPHQIPIPQSPNSSFHIFIFPPFFLIISRRQRVSSTSNPTPPPLPNSSSSPELQRSSPPLSGKISLPTSSSADRAIDHGGHLAVKSASFWGAKIGFLWWLWVVVRVPNYSLVLL